MGEVRVVFRFMDADGDEIEAVTTGEDLEELSYDIVDAANSLGWAMTGLRVQRPAAAEGGQGPT